MSKDKDKDKGKWVSTDDVQALLLQASKVNHVLHVFVRYQDPSAGREFLKKLESSICWGKMTIAGGRTLPKYEVSVGITFKGLQALGVPESHLHIFRRLAPAFAEGAVVRAAERLGDVGASSAKYWDKFFSPENIHTIVTIHSSSDSAVGVREWAEHTLLADLDEHTISHISLTAFLAGERLKPPVSSDEDTAAKKDGVDPWHDVKEEKFARAENAASPPMWVHFGYRDGLTSNRIRTRKDQLKARNLHEPGELLLGEQRNAGDNPWGLVDQPFHVRDFFKHGSFGILRRIEQNEKAFRDQVQNWVNELNLSQHWSSKNTLTAFVRAKLCGRWPNGQIVRVGDDPCKAPDRQIECNEFGFFTDPTQRENESNHSDEDGSGCPYASHIRRMNPRDVDGTQMHRRPLFRRGMPYGKWYRKGEDAGVERGLLGVFFCSDLESQFEHLLGEWADRMPLGMPGDRNQKDPLTGAHTSACTDFSISRRITPDEAVNEVAFQNHTLQNFKPFVRTRGTAYCFYPSKSALSQIVKSVWVSKYRKPGKVG